MLPISRSPLVAVLALGLLLAPGARAATLDLVWTATDGVGTPGGSAIDAIPGETLTLTMRLTLGAGESLSLYSASIRFDTDLADELDLVTVQELSPTDGTGQLDPFDSGPASTQESQLSVQEGNVLSCEAFTLGVGITTPGQYDLCRFEFTVTARVNRQLPNLESGLFNGLSDGFADDDDQSFTPTFQGATVNRSYAVPALGPLGSLALAGLLGGASLRRLSGRRRGGAGSPAPERRG